MTVTETIDSAFAVQKDRYTVVEEQDIYLLKTIHFPKKTPFTYGFLGGMWYSKDQFCFQDDSISLPYPFTTYYTIKILDQTINDSPAKSTLYVKMPVFILQFQNHCYLLEFDPCIDVHQQNLFPFIQLNETTQSYDLSFYLCTSYTIKQKKQAWLGRGKKTTIHHHLQQNDTIQFHTQLSSYPHWENAIKTVVHQHLNTSPDKSIQHNPEDVFSNAKNALWRSYDQKRGTFLQLPWRNTPGFTFVNSSYSLLSYEAVRLDYFSKWYQQTKDKDFNEWMSRLHDLFLQPTIRTIPKKRGKGIIWYNMTTLTKLGLKGYFYMNTGYAGYPGGQATIDLHLLNYLSRYPDPALEDLVEQSLDYILSTQNDDGSWPMAIKQEGILKFRPEALEQYYSHGGTAEAIRALLKGAEHYQRKDMMTAAKKGLEFLTDSDPICVNGLRDIGIMEPEAFSAASVINAFLDAYDIDHHEPYLSSAKTYTAYTLAWIYHWKTNSLPFMYNFHPISYSITPRLSPYETAWIISTYDRLSNYTKETYWTKLNIALFNQVTSWISKTGGLSEGIFPNGLSGFSRLPMEQTFATVELMNSATAMMKNRCISKEKKQKRSRKLDQTLHLSKNQHLLTLKKNNSVIFEFDADQVTVNKIADSPISRPIAYVSLYGANHKQIRRKIIQQMRGNLGKYLISAKDGLYALTGVKGPSPEKRIHLDPIGPKIQSSSINIVEPNHAQISCESAYHHLKIDFQFSTEKTELRIIMNTTVIVKKHDLTSQQQVLFPVINAKADAITEKTLTFDGFRIHGDFTRLLRDETFTAVDQTLQCNWTHAGKCQKEFQIVVPLR